jgi:hypothetical protein
MYVTRELRSVVEEVVKTRLLTKWIDSESHRDHQPRASQTPVHQAAYQQGPQIPAASPQRQEQEAVCA